MNAAVRPASMPAYAVDTSMEFRGYVNSSDGYHLMCTTFGRDIAEREARAERITACLNACSGLVDPSSELLVLQEKAKAYDEFTRGMALLTLELDRAPLAGRQPDYCADPGPAPWVVVDQWPGPLMYMGSSGEWAECLDKAGIFLAYDDALDYAEDIDGEIVSLRWFEQ